MNRIQEDSWGEEITHCPELDEVLQHGGSDEQAVQQWVGQEQDEELVVGETDTVVHPVTEKQETETLWNKHHVQDML